MNWIFAIIEGQQKAIKGGLAAGLVTLLAQIGVNGEMTVTEAAVAVASWVFVHAVVWLTTNK